MYNFFVYDTSILLREIRTEILHLDDMIRWEPSEELNQERLDLFEWRNWVCTHLMAQQRKEPFIPEEEEYHGLW